MQITAGGGVKIDAGQGIVVEYQAHDNLDAAIDELASSPGLAWMADLRSNPNVDWQAVQATVDN